MASGWLAALQPRMTSPRRRRFWHNRTYSRVATTGISPILGWGILEILVRNQNSIRRQFLILTLLGRISAVKSPLRP